MISIQSWIGFRALMVIVRSLKSVHHKDSVCESDVTLTPAAL